VDDVTVAGAVILFVLGWYGLIRLSGHFRPSQWQASVVWCARMKCMSLIETEPPLIQFKVPGSKFKESDQQFRIQTWNLEL